MVLEAALLYLKTRMFTGSWGSSSSSCLPLSTRCILPWFCLSLITLLIHPQIRSTIDTFRFNRYHFHFCLLFRIKRHCLQFYSWSLVLQRLKEHLVSIMSFQCMIRNLRLLAYSLLFFLIPDVSQDIMPFLITL